MPTPFSTLTMSSPAGSAIPPPVAGARSSRAMHASRPSTQTPPVTSEEDALARNARRLGLDSMPTGVDLCRWFKIQGQGPRTPNVGRHAQEDHHARGITMETCRHAANDHRGKGSAYYARCSVRHIHLEYYSRDQPEVQMVRAALKWLSSLRRCKFLNDKTRETLKQACATLKNPPSVAGPRSTAGNGGPHDEADSGSRRVALSAEEEVLVSGFLNQGHEPLTRSKVHGPRQEAAHCQDVPDENRKSWVFVEEDGEEAEATNSQATSNVPFCDIRPHCLNGDDDIESHRAKNRLLVEKWDGGAALGPEAEKATSGRDVPDENERAEDTEISRGAFNATVALVRDPGASDKTIQILTVLAGLLHKGLPEGLRI